MTCCHLQHPRFRFRVSKYTSTNLELLFKFHFKECIYIKFICVLWLKAYFTVSLKKLVMCYKLTFQFQYMLKIVFKLTNTCILHWLYNIWRNWLVKRLSSVPWRENEENFSSVNFLSAFQFNRTKNQVLMLIWMNSCCKNIIQKYNFTTFSILVK